MRVVLHGHFYQPPRENPWTGEIPRQRGASPYHDWNERIIDECYRANGWSRVLGDHGRIAAIVDNYEHLSFDFGPTLLRDLARRAPAVHERILEADRRSVDAHGGHGNAMAQAYNHTILPLTSERDRRTQIRWGKRDFERRFGRPTEGLWLPETAIDGPTLRSLIEAGVRYIVLAPHQARRVRKIGETEWREVSATHPVETGFAHRCHLPEADEKSRRSPDERRFVDVFFYDGALAVAVSFQHLLRNAGEFADRLQAAGRHARGGLVHLATDGEIYGHHERYGDMCLAFFATREAPRRRIELTNYGEELAAHPPTREVELNFGQGDQAGEGTAWSCAHGIGRWVRDCGCTTHEEPGWNQSWRGPLRAGLDVVRDEIQSAFETECAGLLRDPWGARDDYIEVLSDLGDRRALRGVFLERNAARVLSERERTKVWSLLEATHHAMLMYTSCAWFFADVSGLEVKQNLAYAARACELAQPYCSTALEPTLLEHLARAPSNVPRWRDGRRVYLRVVRRRLTAPHVAARAAVEAAFLDRTLPREIHGYRVSGESTVGEAAQGRLELEDLVRESAWRLAWRISDGEDGREIVLETSEVGLSYRLKEVLEAFPSDLRRELGGRLRARQLETARDWLERIHAMEAATWPELPAGRSPLVRAIEETIHAWDVEALRGRLGEARPTVGADGPHEEWWREARTLARRMHRSSPALTSKQGWEAIGREIAKRIESRLMFASGAAERTGSARVERDAAIATALEWLNEARTIRLPIPMTQIEERAYEIVAGLAGGEEPTEPVRRLAEVANLDLAAIRGDQLRRTAAS